jgi:hypothetical protein
MRASAITTPGPWLFALLIALATGCTSTGTGTGSTATGDVQVHFTWQESGATSGNLTATVSEPNGAQEVYQGKFYQITKNTTVDSIGPLWHPWHPGWGGWDYWGPQPTDAFVTHYTGHVLANLAGPGGKRMRCEFQLLRADEGMKGGGEGRCQLPTGNTIRADFPPS